MNTEVYLKTLPPRVIHNLTLADKFNASNGVQGPYKPVSAQRELVPFARRAIKPFGYNPSIVRFGNRILMAYRYHPMPDWKTKLAICEMDETFKIIGLSKNIEIVGAASQEDPHLFVHENTLWMNWVESATIGKSVVKYGRLTEGSTWNIPESFQPKHGQNDGTGMEKNWVFYSQDGKIQFIYSQAPALKTGTVEGDKASLNLSKQAPHFPWGQPKGGTAPLALGGKQIRFWHSNLDNESNIRAINNPNRRYYIGCSQVEPFKLCKRPLLYGSELSDLTASEISACRQYKSNVVFVSGALAMPDGSHVLSVGVNDSECLLVRIKPEELDL